jgi:hypothetical protein
MDTQFWLGVGVTLVGGTIVTVLANLAHPKIVAYLDSRKLLSQEKRRRQAEKFHALILDLRTGRRDRHVYMLRVAVGVIVAFVLAIGGIVGAATTATVVMAIFPEASGDSFAWDPHKLTHAIIPLAMMFFGMSNGGNVRIDYRWSAGDDERVRKYAAELVALAPDVILATGSATVGTLLQATRTIPIVFPIAVDPVGAGFVESLARPGGNASGSATRTIPIVFVNVTDPVGAGLVDSLAQPGSNITGFTLFEYGLSAKWLELLKAATDRIDGVCDVTAELLLAFRRRPFFAFGG